MTAGWLISCVFLAAPASAREDIDNANAAGQRAYFAHEFCGVSAERIEQYKLQLKATFFDTSDFELGWERGWHSEVSQTMQLRTLQATDPKEYAARIKSDCARLKWQAENALRKAK